MAEATNYLIQDQAAWEMDMKRRNSPEYKEAFAKVKKEIEDCGGKVVEIEDSITVEFGELGLPRKVGPELTDRRLNAVAAFMRLINPRPEDVSVEDRYKKAFAEGRDIHKETAVSAEAVSGKDNVTEKRRRATRSLNFPVLFGKTAGVVFGNPK